MRSAILLAFVLGFFASVIIPVPSEGAVEIDYTSVSPNPDYPVSGGVWFSIRVQSISTPTATMYVDGSSPITMVVQSISSSIYSAAAFINTTAYPDGFHTVTFLVKDSSSECYASFRYLFDSSPPEISGAGVHIQEPYTAVKPGAVIRLWANVSDTYVGVKEVTANVSTISNLYDISLYDDGKHDDCLPSDGIYASEAFAVSASTGEYNIPIKAVDVMSNEATGYLQVTVDSEPPEVRGVSHILPPGRSALSPHQQARVLARAADGQTGVIEVYADMTSLGVGLLPMYDDGKHSDGLPSDGLWGSDIFSVDGSVEGVVTYTVKAVDSAGNVGQGSDDIAVDNTPPSIGEVSVLGAGGEIRDGERIHVYVSLSDTIGIEEGWVDFREVGGPSHVPLKDNGVAPDETPGDGRYASEEVTVHSPPGVGIIHVYAVDSAGLMSEKDVAVKVLSDEPFMEVLSPYPGEVLTEMMEVRVRAVALDEVKYRVDGFELVEMGPEGEGIFTGHLPPSAYEDGMHTVCFEGYKDGEVVITRSVNVIFDTSPPEISIVQPSAEVVNGDVEVLVIIKDATDVVSAILEVREGEETVSSAPMPQISLNVYRASLHLPDGRYNLVVKAVDSLGRRNEGAVEVRADSTPPGISGVDGELGVVSGVLSLNPFVSDTSSAHLIWRVDDGPWQDGTIVVNTSSLRDGEHAILLRAEDAAGNRREMVIHFRSDNTAPSVGILSPYPGAVLYGEFPLRVMVFDGNLKEVRITLDNLTTLLPPSPSGLYEMRMDAFSLSRGKHTIVVIAVDEVGHTGRASVTFRSEGGWDEDGGVKGGRDEAIGEEEGSGEGAPSWAYIAVVAALVGWLIAIGLIAFMRPVGPRGGYVE